MPSGNVSTHAAFKNLGERVPLLGFGAFLLTSPVLPPQLSLMGIAIRQGSPDISPVLLVAIALACGIVSSAWSLRHPKVLSCSPGLVVGSSLLYGVGCLGYLLAADGVLPSSELISTVVCLLCGIGGMAPLVAWGVLYAQLDLVDAAWCVVCAVGLAGAVNFLFIIGLFTVSLPVVLVLLGLGLWLPVSAAVKGRLSKDAPQQRTQEAESVDAADDAPVSRKLFSRSMLPVVIGMCLGLFLFVLAASARCEAYGTGIMVREYEYYEAIAPFVAAVCLAAFLAVQKRFDLSETARFYIPVIAVGFFAFSSFAVNTPLFDFGFFSSSALLAAIAILALAALVGATQTGELSPVLLYSLLYAGVALSALLGLSLYSWVPAEGLGAALLVLATVYFVWIVFSALLYQHRLARRTDDGFSCAVGSFDTVVETREALAQNFGLTVREREVLALVATGHGSPYIAERLFISEYTVRTHMRNIYRKVGVSSKEELIGVLEKARTYGD